MLIYPAIDLYDGKAVRLYKGDYANYTGWLWREINKYDNIKIHLNTPLTKEMVTEAEAGWVCDNDQQALNEALCRVAADREALTAVRDRLLATAMDNRVALEQFAAAVNG